MNQEWLTYPGHGYRSLARTDRAACTRLCPHSGIGNTTCPMQPLVNSSMTLSSRWQLQHLHRHTCFLWVQSSTCLVSYLKSAPKNCRTLISPLRRRPTTQTKDDVQNMAGSIAITATVEWKSRAQPISCKIKPSVQTYLSVSYSYFFHLFKGSNTNGEATDGNGFIIVRNLYINPFSYNHEGLVAQWIRRLTTNQEIPGSSPGGVKVFPPYAKFGWKLLEVNN